MSLLRPGLLKKRSHWGKKVSAGTTIWRITPYLKKKSAPGKQGTPAKSGDSKGSAHLGQLVIEPENNLPFERKGFAIPGGGGKKKGKLLFNKKCTSPFSLRQRRKFPLQGNGGPAQKGGEKNSRSRPTSPRVLSNFAGTLGKGRKQKKPSCPTERFPEKGVCLLLGGKKASRWFRG